MHADIFIDVSISSVNRHVTHYQQVFMCLSLSYKAYIRRSEASTRIDLNVIRCSDDNSLTGRTR